MYESIISGAGFRYRGARPVIFSRELIESCGIVASGNLLSLTMTAKSPAHIRLP
jgi:hypothetical protein